MLVQIQKTSSCPGGWYNGLQLCDHINGTYPAPDGTLAKWQALVATLRPMRLMWWTNPTYVWRGREGDLGGEGEEGERELLGETYT